MKKFITTLLIAIVSLSVVACGNGSSTSTEGTMSSKDVTVNNIDITIPDGFTEQADDFWYAPTYPTDTSNINLTTSEKDPNFMDIGADELKASYESAYENEGYTVDVSVDDFQHMVISDFNAFRIQCSYELQGIAVTQIQYIIDADKTYVYTFTDVNNAGWLDQFDSAGKSITVDYTEN